MLKLEKPAKPALFTVCGIILCGFTDGMRILTIKVVHKSMFSKGV